MTHSTSLTEDTYYARHFRLPGFSKATQQRLRKARVLIVGLGGLGCPASLYLAGAGVGHLTLCDGDDVSASNLHRQVLFNASDVGLKKVDVAATRLRQTNPFITVDTVPSFAGPELLEKLVREHDLVLDGTDNFSAKFAINDACETAGVPLVYGSIFQFEGQVSVFHLKGKNGSPGFSYRDLFPVEPPAGLNQNCGEAGVVGVLPGIVGCNQAAEAVKVLAGLGEPLSGRLLTLDVLTGTSSTFSLSRQADEPQSASEVPVEEEPLNVSYEEFERMGPDCLLLDVREVYERAETSLGGLHIPLDELPERLHELSDVRRAVVYCKSGVRSARAVLYLRSVLPSARFFNLRGGIDAKLTNAIVCAA